MNQRLLTFLCGWNEINRRGGGPPVAAAFVLLGFCAFAHFCAFTKLGLAPMFALMDDRTANELAMIHFVHTNPWVAVFYGVILLVSLIWLQSRSAPQWSAWLTFVLFAVPCFVYARACLHIFCKILAVPL